jgi:prepilin-type N-terminal cleavage/methylation domain-containing protein
MAGTTTPPRPRRTAFTLIELLIVVAIIAILAAIAVPNLLEAQTRAKVSRARNDLRVVATGVEAYAVDNNKYPYAPDASLDLDGYGNLRAFAFITVPRGITTPVAYLASTLTDPFKVGRRATTGPNFGKPYRTAVPQDMAFWFMNNRQALDPDYGFFTPDLLEPVLALDGDWRMGSIGPLNLYPLKSNGGTLYDVNSAYDPTNGSISRGMIWRAQKRPEQNNAGAADTLLQ